MGRGVPALHGLLGVVRVRRRDALHPTRPHSLPPPHPRVTPLTRPLPLPSPQRHAHPSHRAPITAAPSLWPLLCSSPVRLALPSSPFSSPQRRPHTRMLWLTVRVVRVWCVQRGRADADDGVQHGLVQHQRMPVHVSAVPHHSRDRHSVHLVRRRTALRLPRPRQQRGGSTSGHEARMSLTVTERACMYVLACVCVRACAHVRVCVCARGRGGVVSWWWRGAPFSSRCSTWTVSRRTASRRRRRTCRTARRPSAAWAAVPTTPGHVPGVAWRGSLRLAVLDPICALPFWDVSTLPSRRFISARSLSYSVFSLLPRRFWSVCLSPVRALSSPSLSSSVCGSSLCAGSCPPGRGARSFFFCRGYSLSHDPILLPPPPPRRRAGPSGPATSATSDWQQPVRPCPVHPSVVWRGVHGALWCFCWVAF